MCSFSICLDVNVFAWFGNACTYMRVTVMNLQVTYDCMCGKCVSACKRTCMYVFVCASVCASVSVCKV